MSETPRLSGIKVMVIDDSNTIRKTAEIFLLQAGAQVVLAEDGFDALAKINDHLPNVVFCDILMPRLDGFGLTAAIRRDARLQHLPVILVTSLDTAEHRERGVTAGADAYLGKRTFDQGQLLDTIGRLL